MPNAARTNRQAVMLKSVTANQQQYVGLQELSALARTLQPFIGPQKKYRFIQNVRSGESALTCSCFCAIQNLEPTCALGQLVCETLQEHEKIYHTGSGCLMFLAGAWSSAALLGLCQGISVTQIISIMNEGIEICLDAVRKSALLFNGLDVRLSRRSTAAVHGLELSLSEEAFCVASNLPFNFQAPPAKVYQQAQNIRGQRQIKLSRYFCENKSEMVSEFETCSFAHIAEGLSHSCDNLMKLAVEVMQVQSRSNQDITTVTFDISKVTTCVLFGLPEDCSCAVPGCIVLLSDEQVSVFHHLKTKRLKVALIDGDLSHSYHHMGFKRPAGMQHVRDQPSVSESSTEDKWVKKVVKLFLDLGVNLILLTGVACKPMDQNCCRNQILVVEKLNSSVLRTFAQSTGSALVTYPSQLRDHCVGTGVQLALWRDLSCYDRKLVPVNISTEENTGLVTAILTSSVQCKSQLQQDRFWACAYRLHHALKDRALLPGAGRTEMFCIHLLQKQAQNCREKSTNSVPPSAAGTAVALHTSVMLELMADGLMDYITTVMINSGKMSKVEARTIVTRQLQTFDVHQGNATKFPQLVLGNENEAFVFPSRKQTECAPAVEVYDNLCVKQEAWRRALDLVFLVLQTDEEVVSGLDQKMEKDTMML
ncbi:Bardet-Biedl syndrome 12 protein isoform X2 [Oryzias melastigma]|uniref:Bardet-Biedl syndrome 12 protein isoform X2 n=1 Tax=Oryzias melastigma TaxID=30732 RepID=UPI000CF803CB|nr:Bardet-Biedl syndrome 12 protein isoform X2 [Oryzias melastigma]